MPSVNIAKSTVRSKMIMKNEIEGEYMTINIFPTYIMAASMMTKGMEA